MTEKPLNDPCFAPENFDISDLQDEIRATRLTGDLLKHFYLHLTGKIGLSPEDASALAYGANYFLTDFIIDDRRLSILDIEPLRVRQFAGNWYVVRNMEPNMKELGVLLRAVSEFYSFAAEAGLVAGDLPPQIEQACNDLDYYQGRIEAFWAIEDDGFSAWDRECSLKP